MHHATALSDRKSPRLRKRTNRRRETPIRVQASGNHEFEGATGRPWFPSTTERQRKERWDDEQLLGIKRMHRRRRRRSWDRGVSVTVSVTKSGAHFVRLASCGVHVSCKLQGLCGQFDPAAVTAGCRIKDFFPLPTSMISMITPQLVFKTPAFPPFLLSQLLVPDGQAIQKRAH